MKQRSSPQKYIAFALSCVFILILTSQHAAAARRSKVLSIALFASGVSLQFGSNVLKAAAQNRYDAYLNAAIQADIQTHRDAFLVRQSAGTLMSRVGLGCVGLAVLFSMYSQLDTPEPLEDAALSVENWGTESEIRITRFSGFINRSPENMRLRLPKTSFQLHPSYDFQTRRASLSLLHFF